MEAVTTLQTTPRDPAKWQAAQDLQKALFTELFRSAGFAEAFSTGSAPLDALSEHVLERIAEDVAANDQGLAEAFYKQLTE